MAGLGLSLDTGRASVQTPLMAEIVNLNRARKTRAAAADKRQAEQNRVVHGRTKAEKLAAKAEQDRTQRLLEGQKLKD